MNFSQLTELYQLKKEAEKQGQNDVVEEINALLLAEQDKPDYMSRESRVLEEAGRKEQKEYQKLLGQRDQLKGLMEDALMQGQDDVVSEIKTVQTDIDNKIFDYEDITEEVAGATLAATEALTVGLVGDETAAKLYSTATGMDYNTALSETRRIQKEFSEDQQALDIGIRIAAGFVPAVRLAKLAGVGTTAAGGVARQAGVTGAEIGTYAFAEGEGGLEERLEAVGEVATDPLAIGATVLAGGLGGVAGRAVGRDMELTADLRNAAEAFEARSQALRVGKGTVAQEKEAVSEAVEIADNLVINFYNQNGAMPEGVELARIYNQAAEQVEAPLIRIMRMKGGKAKDELDYRNKSIDDVRKRSNENIVFRSDETATRKKNLFSAFWEDKLESLVKVARNRVGENFGGNMQRMATTMAQNQQAIDIVYNSSPVKAFTHVLESDPTGRLRAKILNFSNQRLSAEVRQQEFDSFRKMLTDEQFKGYQNLSELRFNQANEYRSYVYRELSDDPLYFPSQKLSVVEQSSYLNRLGYARQSADNNMKRMERDFVSPEEALEYQNPIASLRDKLAHDDAVIQLHRAFKLENNSNRVKNKKTAKRVKKELERGDASFVALREGLKKAGAGEGAIQTAEELTRSLIVRGTQAPNTWVSSLRKAGYVGTIANPYSALLNFGDAANTVVNFGADNTAQALLSFYNKNGIRMGVRDVGLLNQPTGEFLREGQNRWLKRFDDLSEFSFKASGFRDADILGKGLTLNAAVKKGQRQALDGTLKDEYSWLFSPSEMAALRADLIKGNKTQRVREFAAAELAKLQPSDLAQMPKWYLDHPNGRILYMLRSFGIKQLQQINRLVVEEAKKGNPAEAAKNALAYLTVVGGGNTLLNELRQPIMLREPGPDVDRMEEYFVDFMLGLVSVNSVSTYNIKKAQQGDIIDASMGFFPASADMAVDSLEDVSDYFSGRKDIEDLVYEGKGVRWLPFMRIAQPYLQEYN